MKIALCEMCRHCDWEKVSELREVFKESGLEGPHSIWCKQIDAPEDMRWEHCPHGFEAMG